MSDVEITGYTIKERIGAGGMATVYLAMQESLERLVALKVLDNQFIQDTTNSVAQRFINEGRIIASLRHPNIITIFDIGLSDNDHSFYISMEYVRGGDLKQRMAGYISPQEALDIIYKIGSALTVAHQRNIIHRDVKPGNILFREDNTPLLTDFGIAKQDHSNGDETVAGLFLGSPNYVSPEQSDGLAIDHRSDIYSLGCVFYEMLTNAKPYQGKSVVDIILQHKSAPVPTLPGSLAIYQGLLDQMMAKEMDLRFKDTTELLAMVEQLNGTDQVQQHKPRDPDATTQINHHPRHLKQKKLKWLLAGVVMATAFFLIIQFVDIRLKKSSDINEVSTQSAIPQELSINQQFGDNASPKYWNEPHTNTENHAEFHRALLWLGNKSLREYRLTYPPEDNAYHYFSRLLQLEPDNQQAYKGILAIAKQYAVLVEHAIDNNEIEKAKAFVEIGFNIDPNNAKLLKFKKTLAQ